MKQNIVTFFDQDLPKSGLSRRGSLHPTAGTAPSVSVRVRVCACIHMCLYVHGSVCVISYKAVV